MRLRNYYQLQVEAGTASHLGSHVSSELLDDVFPGLLKRDYSPSFASVLPPQPRTYVRFHLVTVLVQVIFNVRIPGGQVEESLEIQFNVGRFQESL
jgi:hypothetical protein